jgi:glutamate-1-semialdehyde 2,1-aminomutase
MSSRQLGPTPLPTPSFTSFCDPSRFDYRDEDRDQFAARFANFVPPDSFDAHAHIYDLRHIVPADEAIGDAAEVDHRRLVASMQKWMGESVIRDGLYFPFPRANTDVDAANEFLGRVLKDSPGSRGLMLIRPGDDPAHVQSVLELHGFSGFKVYHVYASRPDTFQAEIGEFLPDWAWELADQKQLAITLHMVLPTALRDERNQSYIIEKCRHYSGAKLILAHAARGFNGMDTVEGIDSLRGLSNVYFDTSAICESTAFEAVLRACGPSRLMYGSDFPVSELRGKAFSLGDGFYWLFGHQWEQLGCRNQGVPTLVGLESLGALQLACRNLGLNDRDVERIFSGNARELLGLRTASSQRGRSTYEEAKQRIPGGVQLLSKRPEMFAPDVWPAYFEEAIGCEVVDLDGRRFLDMSHCGILSCLLGFADPDVNRAVIRRVTLGNMATQQTADEVRLAGLLTELHPWADQARFTRSGGEAMAVAVRIARAATSKSKVAICGYHGWHDWYVASNLGVSDSAGAGKGGGDGNGGASIEGTAKRPLDGHLLPGILPAGVPVELSGTVLAFDYNDLEGFEHLVRSSGAELAAVVMEPTRSEDPHPRFLQTIRQRTSEVGAVLIFDEISSGWRQCVGGAHLLYGVAPDIAVFAKAMSNGYPMGAIIGRRGIMEAAESSFISSTYWTEGIGPAAALATIEKLQRNDIPGHLRKHGRLIQGEWTRLSAEHGIPLSIRGREVAPSFSFNHPQSLELMTLFTTWMLDRNILACGSCSLTWAHQSHHVQRYLKAVDQVFGDLATALRHDTVLDSLRGPVRHDGFRRLVE